MKHLPYFDQHKKKLQSPHIVILGAGASKAAFPKGDKNGKNIPLMNDLTKVLKIEQLLTDRGLSDYLQDFEVLYSKISEEKNLQDLKEIVNKKVIEFFSSLELPESTTIYDYLILSLKEKDLIATFNWDPFLLQAYKRNLCVGNLPKLAFLHGNVFIGACNEDQTIGFIDSICNKCRKPLQPVDLLFPVTHKDYNSNPIIKSQWNLLEGYLKIAYFLTIFGYSAPKSDVEAISIMKKAWQDNGSIELSEVEVIDIKSHEDVYESWKEFTTREHYGIMDSFKYSWLWQYPRESGEALFNATLQSDPITDNPFIESAELSKVQEFAKGINIRELRL